MIHKYKMNGYNIVLDVNSGAVHVVDDIAYDLLDFYLEKSKEDIINLFKDRYNEADIRDALKEIEESKRNETLFSEDIYSNYIEETNNRNPLIKAMCLHVTHDCNLKCKYCFAEEGEYKSGKRSLMTFETGKKAFDFLIENSGTRRNLEIDFFGGEPLMNFDVVKQLVFYGREIEKEKNKNFRFTITTNGVLLDSEKENFINEHMQNVVLSIDGRKNINDQMRPNFANDGTYEKIVPKFKKIAESRNQNNYYVRGTFTRYNLDFSEDVFHLADLGFKQISIEPVVAEEINDYAIKDSDLETIFKEYEKLAIKMIERKKENKDFNFFHFMIDLTGGPCAYKRLVGCGAGTEYIAVTPEGEIYPCHQFVGNEEYKLGDIFNGINKKHLVLEFEKCHVYTKEDCKDCFAKFYCSGGCVSNAYNYSGSILKPYKIGCEMQKKRVECAIMMKVFEAFGQEEK